MYTKVMSMFDKKRIDEFHPLRNLLITVYGPLNNTAALGLTQAFTLSGYSKDIPRTLRSIEALSEQRTDTLIERTITAVRRSGMTDTDSAAFLTDLLLRYGRNALFAYAAVSALSGQGRQSADIINFFALLARYDIAELAPMWPYLSRTLELPVDPASIFNCDRTGLFDSIIANFTHDPLTRKYGWCYDLLKYGISPEHIYTPDGKDGILDQVSSRYINGTARKVVASLISIAKKAYQLNIPAALLTNNAHAGLFDRLPSHYHYNDLHTLEEEVEGVRVRLDSIVRENGTAFAWTSEDIAPLIHIGSATVSWSTNVPPMELR